MLKLVEKFVPHAMDDLRNQHEHEEKGHYTHFGLSQSRQKSFPPEVFQVCLVLVVVRKTAGTGLRLVSHFLYLSHEVLNVRRGPQFEEFASARMMASAVVLMLTAGSIPSPNPRVRRNMNLMKLYHNQYEC